MTIESDEIRERRIFYETAVIQSFGLEVRVTVELREKNIFTCEYDRYEKTGNWFSCVTDLKEGHILGGQTSGSGNLSESSLDIAKSILHGRLKKGQIQ